MSLATGNSAWETARLEDVSKQDRVDGPIEVPCVWAERVRRPESPFVADGSKVEPMDPCAHCESRSFPARGPPEVEGGSDVATQARVFPELLFRVSIAAVISVLAGRVDFSNVHKVVADTYVQRVARATRRSKLPLCRRC